MKKIAFFLLPFLLLLADGEIDLTPYIPVEDTCSFSIKTPSLQNIYREKLILPNGMKVILFSDKETNTSSAALAVGVGSWDDDPNYPGIAHFCEHMLFMGSKKYPQENGYMECLAKGQGLPSAGTSSTHTLYNFCVTNSAFDETLDRFSRFFIDPLFLADCIEREANAIDEEFQRSKNDEGTRIRHVLMQEGNQQHPNCRFFCGSKETIGNIPREQMIAWYKKHYSADKMTLCIYSNKSLQELKEQVVATFSSVKTKETPKREVPTNLFSEKLKGSLIQIQTIRDLKEINLTWEFPQTTAATYKASIVLNLALSHSTKGGLQHHLQQQGLAHLVTASSNLNNSTLTSNIAVLLTDKGFAEIERVVAEIFAALHTLKEGGIPPYLHEDFQQHITNSYEWTSRRDANDSTATIATDLLYKDFASYPQNEIDLGPFDADVYDALLKRLTPHEALFMVLNNFPNQQQYLEQLEPYYNVAYHLEKIPNTTLDFWQDVPPHQAAIVPVKNPFLSEKVELFTRDLPPIIEKNRKGICYFHEDAEFFIPRVQVYVGIKNPAFEKNARSCMIADFYFAYLERELEPIQAQAAFAEIFSEISFANLKAQLYVDSYNDSIQTFLPALLRAMKSIEFNEQRFNDLKQAYLRSYQNYEYAHPLTKAANSIKKHTTDLFIEEKESVAILKALSLDDLKTLHETIFVQNYLEVLVAGDTGVEIAKQIFDMLSSELCTKEYDGEHHPIIESIPFYKEDFSKTLCIKGATKGQGNGMALMLDLGKNTPEKKAVSSIIGNFVQEAYFNSLRTKQQLCYEIVACFSHTKKRCFAEFMINSAQYSSDYVLEKTYDFLKKYRENLTQNITEDAFESAKTSALEKFKEPFKTPQGVSRSINHLLFVENGNYSSYKEHRKALENLSYDRFLEITMEMLDLSLPEKRMEVLITGDAN